MGSRDETPAAVLLARLLRALFVRCLPGTTFELVVAGARSPLKGLVATPAFLALGDQRLSHELLVAPERLAKEHFLVEAVVSSCGDSRAVVRPCGALEFVVRVREAPTLVAVVTVVRRRSFAEPFGDMGDARLSVALFGFRLEPDNRVGVLGEVIGPDGIHYFLLATLEAEAERLRRGFLQMTALRTSGEPSQSSTAGGVGLVVDSFRPKYATPARQRLVMIRSPSVPEGDDAGLVFRWSRHGEGWNLQE
jgi:hypothetical protein